jgi:hypothetical protein
VKKIAKVLVAGVGLWLVALLALAAEGCGPKPKPNYPPGAVECATACAHVAHDMPLCGVSNRLCLDICERAAVNHPEYPGCLAMAFSCADFTACDPQ